MALVTATITVDFDANYAGDHRVCWRIQGSGSAYDCTTVVNCVGGGTTCQAIFNADVNTTSCDGTVVFEGYVQAACEDIASTNGRLPFTVNFVPNPICNRVEITCAYGTIDAIVINDGGSLYAVGDTVVITRDGADTQIDDAVISINAVGDGVLNSVSGILSAGTGYTVSDVINVDNAGFGGGAQITVDSIGGSGEILTFTLTANGSGYVGPGSSFTYTGGTGAGASFDFQEGVDFDTDGKVLSFTITDGGSYSIVPTITIIPDTSIDGGGFDGTVHIEDCPAYNDIGLDCTGALVHLTSGLPHLNTVAVCLDDDLYGLAPDEYTVTETGCCIPSDTDASPNTTCIDYHVENTSGAPINVQYTACGGIDTTVAVPATTTISVCAVEDGVVNLNDPDIIVTNTGTPCDIA